MRARLLVGAGGADENVLAGFAAEKLEASLDRCGVEGDEVDDGVPSLVGERGNARGVIDIACELSRAADAVSARAIEQRHLETAGHRELGNRRADETSAAEEKDLHIEKAKSEIRNSKSEI